MVVERDLLISLLKLTKDESVLLELVKRDAKTTLSITRKMLEKLQNEGMIYLNQNKVEADSYGRLKLAIKAVSIGADVEYVSNMLSWQEFEGIAAIALERNGYTVRNSEDRYS